EYNFESLRECKANLPVNKGICFAIQRAALGVTKNYCSNAQVLEHSRTHLASVRAGFFGGHVLGSQQYAGGAKRPLDGIECREAWSNHYLCIRLADGLCKFSNKGRS